jgi:hypothetical protein
MICCICLDPKEGTENDDEDLWELEDFGDVQLASRSISGRRKMYFMLFDIQDCLIESLWNQIASQAGQLGLAVSEQ